LEREICLILLFEVVGLAIAGDEAIKELLTIGWRGNCDSGLENL